MSKHTPEPWYSVGPLAEEECGIAGGVAPQIGIPSDDFGCPVIIGELYEEADQERVVACVNACAGMSDPAAEIARLRQLLRLSADVIDDSLEERAPRHSLGGLLAQIETALREANQ